MSINIRYPNITGLSEKEQLAQVKSYLHQLVDQLNYALPNIGTGDGEKQTESTQSASSKTYEVQGGDVSYYEFRSLIIQELQKVEDLIDEIKRDKESGEFDGADGKDGQDGHTPIYGEDYFTDDDITKSAKRVAEIISFTLDEETGELYYEYPDSQTTNGENIDNEEVE